MKTKQLPKEWKEVELGEAFEIKKGKSITRDLVTTGTVPVIAGGQNPAYYHNESNREGETITISGSGAYAGFVNYFNRPIFASDCSTMQVRNKEENLAKYGFYFLKSNQNKIYGLQKGIAQPHVYPKDLTLLKIPLPPLQTQKAIVQILEQAEQLKQKREQADKLMDEYLKSVFNEMFLKNGFEEVKLGNICELKSGGTPSRTNEEFFRGDIPWITSVSLGKKYINQTDAIEFITEKAIKNSATKLILKNSILIGTRVGVGKTSINLCEICTNQDIIALTNINSRLINEFLLFILNYYSAYLNSQKRGATIQGVTSSVLKSLKIPLPPLALQQKFASIVEKVETLKEAQKKSKQEIGKLFNVLMQKAFKGELVR